MQEVLVQKQQDEIEVQNQLQNKKKLKEIIDLGHGNDKGLDMGLDLKNVLYERDNLREQLTAAQKSIEEVQKKLKHFEEVQIQLQTFDDEDVYEQIDKEIMNSAYKNKMQKLEH